MIHRFIFNLIIIFTRKIRWRMPPPTTTGWTYSGILSRRNAGTGVPAEVGQFNVSLVRPVCPAARVKKQPNLDKILRRVCCLDLTENPSKYEISLILSSVTRLGDLLDFRQLLKPLATINLSKSPTFLGNFCKVSKSIIFLVKSFLGNFNRHLAIFSGHTDPQSRLSQHQINKVRPNPT